MSLEQADGKQDRLPPALELEVLKVLWADDGELSVAEVQEAMKLYRPLAYTTVLTLLERLYRKGQVSRRKQGRGFSYRPVLARDAALDLALDRLAKDFFGNSRQMLLVHLQNSVPIETDESSQQELDSALL
jgi:BlaI family transcriptional regulator, penicillinase repressor